MKNIELRGHIYERLVNEYGFKKREDNEYVYENENMIMFFAIQKSIFSNSAIIHAILSPRDYLDYIKKDSAEKFITRFSAEVCVTEFFKMNKDNYSNYVELDKIMNFEHVDKEIDNFFINIFPKLQTSEEIKNFAIENAIFVEEDILTFWGVDKKEWRKKRAVKLAQRRMKLAQLLE